MSDLSLAICRDELCGEEIMKDFLRRKKCLLIIKLNSIPATRKINVASLKRCSLNWHIKYEFLVLKI